MAYYYQLREQVWPYGRLWGDREERKAVRSYLKKVWEDNNDTHRVEDTLENVRREKDQILYWWWSARYGQSGTADTTSEYFGQWLLSQYQDYIKLHHPTNRKTGRN